MRCKECGADVPVLREFCVNCGAPTDPGLRERKNQLLQGQRPRTGGVPKGTGKTILIGAVALLGFGILASDGFDAAFDSDDDDRIVIVERDEPRGAVTIEADELYKAYRDDPDAAEQRFEDREMVVSGEFLRIVPDGYDSLDLRLKTSNPNAHVGVDLAQLAIEDGKNLVPGQRVTVSCQKMGAGGDELWVQDCAIQANAETDAATAAEAAVVPQGAGEPPAVEGGSPEG